MARKSENQESEQENATKKTIEKKSKKNTKKKPKTGLIFWAGFAIIIMICFLVARGRIASVLKETDFFNEVTGSEPALITDLINSQDTNTEEKSEKESKKTKKISKSEKSDKTSKSEKTKKKTKDETITVNERNESELTERAEIVSKAEKEAQKESQKEQTEKVETTTKTEKNETENKTQVEQKQMMSINLCFVHIDDSDGSIIRMESVRSVEKNDSPLTTAINALLAGPNMSEIQKGCVSLIPQNSRLLGVRISNRTAILNFSEDFMFNTYSVQGQITQLMQIVYTATSFSTIDNVQFLIEGQKVEYIGGEGVWIGSPLSRFSFK